MKKVRIEIEEKITYIEEIIAIQPDEMTDEEFDKLLDLAERENRRFEGGTKDLAYILENKGIKIHDQSFNFPNDPRHSELEIDGVTVLK